MADNSPSAGEDLVEKFQEWNIDEQTIQHFCDNGITFELFKTLNDDNLRELCPHLATRIILRTKMETYKKAAQVTNSEEDANDMNAHQLSRDSNNFNELLNNQVEIIDPFPEFSLQTLLDNSPEGRKIRKNYETHGRLQPSSQQDLADIICRELYPWLKSGHKLKNYHYAALLSKIKNEFPLTSLGVFYSSPVTAKNSKTGKFVPARGKLPDKVKNILWVPNSGKKRKICDLNDNHDEDRKSVEELRKKYEKSLKWLKHHCNPWNQVITKWKETYELRSKMTFFTVAEFLQEWAIFNDQRSTELIYIDFNSMYPGKEDIFMNGWNTFYSKLKLLRSEKYKNDKLIKALREKLKKLGTTEADINLKLLIEMKIVAHLIPPKSRRFINDKIATQEAIDSIFHFAPTASDVELTISNVQNDHYNRNERVQPYLIIQGSIDELDQILIVIDKIRYECDSVLVALDCLFKLYHVFHAEYPKSGIHLYLLIQRCVYQITTKYDILPASIKDTVEIFETTA
ncbi:uncharacterized protein LOC130677454 [Microplitis mediator]|uniref:uncharacterized protein LOC130677454 n=1 Tax=Microplitis mediator TaxID=375433 RepID=UPI002555B256|nr:uncharacterized protein LOC130677454 [Microplitis mediator]